MGDNVIRTSGVERLYPFALRSRIVITGRERMARLTKKIHFVIISTELSENSEQEIRETFKGIPIFKKYSVAEIEQHFQFKGTKVLGFLKSQLSQSVLKELKGVTETSPV